MKPKKRIDPIYDFFYEAWVTNRLVYGAYDEVKIKGKLVLININ
jgi:hypothetical protein